MLTIIDPETTVMHEYLPTIASCFANRQDTDGFKCCLAMSAKKCAAARLMCMVLAEHYPASAVAIRDLVLKDTQS